MIELFWPSYLPVVYGAMKPLNSLKLRAQTEADD